MCSVAQIKSLKYSRHYFNLSTQENLAATCQSLSFVIHLPMTLQKIIGQTRINPSNSLKRLFFHALAKHKIKKIDLKEQRYSMDTFKGQDNDILKKICSETNCETGAVTHNLINKFLLLIINTTKAAKTFVITIGFPPKFQCR